jgi:hypothetical protein
MHEVPWPHVTALPVSQGVPGETPAEHDTTQMKSEVLENAALLAPRDPMVGWYLRRSFGARSRPIGESPQGTLRGTSDGRRG